MLVKKLDGIVARMVVLESKLGMMQEPPRTLPRMPSPPLVSQQATVLPSEQVKLPPEGMPPGTAETATAPARIAKTVENCIFAG